MEKQLKELSEKKTSRVKGIDFHPVYQTYITGHHCGKIHIWCYHYDQPIYTISEHIGSVRTVKFHKSGEIFASGGDDRMIRVWNYRTRDLLHTLKGHTDYIRAIDFHPTRPWIVSASDDCTIKIWNYSTGKLLCSSSGHSHFIMGVAVLDDTHILTGSQDHTLGLWNCSNLFVGKSILKPGLVLVHTIEAHTRGVNSIYYNGISVVSGGDDRELKRWNYFDGVISPSKSYYMNGPITTMCLENEEMIIGSENGQLAYKTAGSSYKIDIGSRIWCVRRKGDYVAAGTDDGLKFYVLKRDFIGTSSSSPMCLHAECPCGKKSIKSESKKLEDIYIYDGKNILRNGNVYYQCKRKPVGLCASGEMLLVRMDGAYEVVVDGKMTECGEGWGVLHGEDIFSICDDVLYRNGNEIGKTAGVWCCSSNGLFIVKGCIVWVGKRKYNAGFSVKDVKCDGKNIFIIGLKQIVVLNMEMEYVDAVCEYVEIHSAVIGNVGNMQNILIYSTPRQIKYFFKGVGILQSIEDGMKILCVENGILHGLCGDEIKRMELSMGEVLFRMAEKKKDILETIKKEKLPGMGPVQYLIDSGNGDIAVPYVSDDDIKFDLLLSSGDLEGAYRLCQGRDMLRKLGERALELGNCEVSERVLVKLNDMEGLFMLYLSSKQYEKMKGLDGNIAIMSGMINEDLSLIKRFLNPNVFENGKAEKKSDKEKISNDDKRIDGEDANDTLYSINEKIEKSLHISEKDSEQEENADAQNSVNEKYEDKTAETVNTQVTSSK